MEEGTEGMKGREGRERDCDTRFLGKTQPCSHELIVAADACSGSGQEWSL